MVFAADRSQASGGTELGLQRIRRAFFCRSAAA